MTKQKYTMFAVATILLLGSSFSFSQANAQSDGIYVTKKLTNFTEPGFVSASLLVCAGNESLSNPEIVVFSDIESKILALNGNVQANQCRGETILIETNDLSSITADFISLSQPLLVDEFPYVLEQEEFNPISGVKNTLTIPYWFSDTMSWYLDGVVSETELTSGMKYLYEENIISFV